MHDIMADFPEGDKMKCDGFENDISEHHRRMVRLRRVDGHDRAEDFACSLNKSPKSKSPFPKKFKGRCKHCGMIGHKEIQCWRKQSPGEERKTSFRVNDGPRINGNCNWCQKKGHMERFCRSKKAGKPRAKNLDRCNATLDSDIESSDTETEEVAFSMADMKKVMKDFKEDKMFYDPNNHCQPLMEQSEEEADNASNVGSLKISSENPNEEWGKALEVSTEDLNHLDEPATLHGTGPEEECWDCPEEPKNWSDAVNIESDKLKALKAAFSDNMIGAVEATDNWSEFEESNNKEDCHGSMCEGEGTDEQCEPTMKRGHEKLAGWICVKKKPRSIGGGPHQVNSKWTLKLTVSGIVK